MDSIKLFPIKVLSDTYFVDADLIHMVPRGYMKKGVCCPVRDANNTIVLLIGDHDNYVEWGKRILFLLDDLHISEVRPVPQSILWDVVNSVYADVEVQRLKLDSDTDRSPHDVLDSFVELHESGSNVARIVDVLFREACNMAVSDIHVFPYEKHLIIKYRIDGVLYLKHQLSAEYIHSIIARVKVLSDMDVAETRRPQDGSLKYVFGEQSIDMRISTIPVAYGEKMVIRLLGNNANLLNSIHEIGLDESDILYLSQQLCRSEGMILVTGPTGSGKTTTLYAFLDAIIGSSKNIVTIEDPVERIIQGISQINVNKNLGLTFSIALKHILRQDPDVIMLGELRDGEVAKVSLQAAMTGHLVLGTLHTVDAPSAGLRLLDMGIEPWLLSSVISCVVAQRLIRLICEKCRVSNISDEQKMAANMLSIAHSDCCVGQGCSECMFTGYKKRCAIFEIFKFDYDVAKSFHNGVPDIRVLRELAVQQGMVSMHTKGVNMVKKGLTTPSEVVRVISLS